MSSHTGPPEGAEHEELRQSVVSAWHDAWAWRRIHQSEPNPPARRPDDERIVRVIRPPARQVVGFPSAPASQRPRCRHQLFVGGRPLESGEAVAGAFDVRPPHDPVTWAAAEPGGAAYQCRRFRPSRSRPVGRSWRTPGRSGRGRSACRPTRSPSLRPPLRSPASSKCSERPVCEKVEIGGRRQWHGPVAEIEAGALDGRRDDRQHLDPELLELRRGPSQLNELAPAERSVQATQQHQKNRALAPRAWRSEAGLEAMSRPYPCPVKC